MKKLPPVSSSPNEQAHGAQRVLHGIFLGTRPYAPVFALMEQLFVARRDKSVADVVLLLEHEPVITFGRGAKAENLLANELTLKRLGVDVVDTGRGGDVTLHAPGQLIAYPIIDLSPDRQDVRKYVQGLTRVMNQLILPYGLQGGTMAQLIGLWLDKESPGAWPGEDNVNTPAKIGAIGVRISRWITQHGFALNLTTDLSLFSLIVPCGIKEHGVTSVQTLTGKSPVLRDMATAAHEALRTEYGATTGQLFDAENASLSGLVQLLQELHRAEERA